MLSVILTASLLFPDLGAGFILGVLAAGTAATIAAWFVSVAAGRSRRSPIDRGGRADWRMPPLAELAAPSMSLRGRLWMSVLRLYLVAAAGLVLFRIVQLALFHHA